MKNIQISQTQIADFCRQHQQARLGLMAYAGIQRELSELLQRPVDLVTRDGLKPLIKQAVLDNAQVIYAA
jgi:predicted nucleotidyltransferase